MENYFLGDDTGLNISMKVPGDPSQWKDYLEAITLNNERMLAASSYPDLYQSGIVYRPEQGTEHWKHIDELYRDGFGDCEDLATARAAQLRLMGIDARAAVVKTAPNMYHAIVAGPDNTILEDPTKLVRIAEHMKYKPDQAAFRVEKKGNMYLGAFGVPAQLYNSMGVPTVKGYVQSLGADTDPGAALLKAMMAAVSSPKKTETKGAGVNSLLSLMPGMVNSNTDPGLLMMLLNEKEINTPEKNKTLLQYLTSQKAEQTGLQQLLKQLTKSSTSTEDAEMKKLLALLQAQQNASAGFGSGFSDPYSTAMKEAASLLKDEGFRKDMASAGKYVAEGVSNVFSSIFGRSRGRSRSRGRGRR